jgi:hypothetical protein
MRYQSCAVLFGVLLFIPRAFAGGGYFQLLNNSHIGEIRIDYCVFDGNSLYASHQNRLLHNSRQVWTLDKQHLIQQTSRMSTEEVAAEETLKSKSSQYEYDYGYISLADSTNDLTVLESQMNRIATGNWIPPLPATGHTSLEVACPLLGCFVAGNPYMQRYEGAYAIRARGPEAFKGIPCLKYTYSITGPFSTHFRRKGLITEHEGEALLKLQQDLTVSGTILVDVATGIICARAEETQFIVVEAQRVDLTSKWVTTREHTRVVQNRSWIMKSVTTVYR